MGSDYEILGGPFDGDHWRVPHGHVVPQVIRVSRPGVIGCKHLYTLGQFKGQQVYRYEGPAQ